MSVEAIVQGRIIVENYPTALNNLLANKDYAEQVSSFLFSSYATCLDRHGVTATGGLQNYQDEQEKLALVQSVERYACDSIEALADHVLNCCASLGDFLDAQDCVLGDLTEKISLLTHRVKASRQISARISGSSVRRPRQKLGKEKSRIPDSVPVMERHDRWVVDFTHLDNVGIAQGLPEGSPTGGAGGGYQQSSAPISSEHELSRSSETFGLSAGSFAGVSAPGPPPSVLFAPGPPPFVDGPGPAPAVVSMGTGSRKFSNSAFRNSFSGQQSPVAAQFNNSFGPPPPGFNPKVNGAPPPPAPPSFFNSNSAGPPPGGPSPASGGIPPPPPPPPPVRR